MRVRFDIAYDGRFFHGWAAQPEIRTIQGEIQAALAQVLRREITLTVAGRTDAGVHALGQVAHADLAEKELKELGDPQRLATRLTAILAMRAAPFTNDPRGHSDVVINQIRIVNPDFDARFSALSRHYEYKLATGWKNPLERNHTWWLKTLQPLNLAAMQQFSTQLLGEHDFLSFCKPRPGATTIRTLKSFAIHHQLATAPTKNYVQSGAQPEDTQTPEPTALKLDPMATGQTFSIHVQADAFCHSMVRSLIGALVQVGRGSKPVEWGRELIGNPSRSHSVPLAPPHGLTLMKVDYPPSEQYGSQAQLTRRLRASCCE